MKNFRLYDMYDFYGVHLSKNNRIGEYDTIAEAQAAAAEYDLSCDGECCVWICQRNPETNTFLAIDAEPMVYELDEDEEVGA